MLKIGKRGHSHPLFPGSLVSVLVTTRFLVQPVDKCPEDLSYLTVQTRSPPSLVDVALDTLRKGGFIVAHASQVQSLVAASGHTASVVRKQG